MTHRTFDNPLSIEARQALLDRRCERTHPKRHRTRKRSIKQKARIKQRTGQRAVIKLAAVREMKAMTRAFWLGQTDIHPMRAA